MNESQAIEPGGRKRKFAALDDKEVFRLAKYKMETEKRYLDPLLKMELLAGEMNVHRNMLSRAVNTYTGVTFATWMLSYRMAELERLAAMKENKTIQTARLAREAGFGSRTTLYRNFQMMRGITPEQWRKKKKK